MNRDKWDKIKRVLIKQDRTLLKSLIAIYNLTVRPYMCILSSSFHSCFY